MVPTVKIERTIEGRDHGFIRPPGGTFRPPNPWGIGPTHQTPGSGPRLSRP
jgi:hypothetical protein